jgi:hypothetical protein
MPEIDQTILHGGTVKKTSGGETGIVRKAYDAGGYTIMAHRNATYSRQLPHRGSRWRVNYEWANGLSNLILTA